MKSSAVFNQTVNLFSWGQHRRLMDKLNCTICSLIQMSDKVLVNVSNTLGNISGNRLYDQTYQFLYHMAIVDNIVPSQPYFKAENSVLTVHLISMMTDVCMNNNIYSQSMSYSSRMDLPTLQHLITIVVCQEAWKRRHELEASQKVFVTMFPHPPPLPILTAKAPNPKCHNSFFIPCLFYPKHS